MKLVQGFTERYNIHKLVYFEETTDINNAALHPGEKSSKNGNGLLKFDAINRMNPEWKDLYIEMTK